MNVRLPPSRLQNRTVGIVQLSRHISITTSIEHRIVRCVKTPAPRAGWCVIMKLERAVEALLSECNKQTSRELVLDAKQWECQVQAHQRQSNDRLQLHRKYERAFQRGRPARGAYQASSVRLCRGAMQSHRHRKLAFLFRRLGFQWMTWEIEYRRNHSRSIMNLHFSLPIRNSIKYFWIPQRRY